MIDSNGILKGLEEMYPDAHCELDFSNPFELLIATILSAQSTDRQVNKVTQSLFLKYKGPQQIASCTEGELEKEIRGLGLFRNKSKNIKKTCEILVAKYNGEVPRDRNLLEQLPGVGRKTANVVLSNAFNFPAIAVDTHVFRVANRLGLATSKDVLRTEYQLMDVVPENEWTNTHHRLIWHGRRVCHARSPKCSSCPLKKYCKYQATEIG